MKARKKPIEVEVWKVGGFVDDIPEWAHSNDVTPAQFVFEKDGDYEVHHVIIKTLEGNMVGNRGDFVVLGAAGELYPVRPDIFEKTFDLI